MCESLEIIGSMPESSKRSFSKQPGRTGRGVLSPPGRVLRRPGGGDAAEALLGGAPLLRRGAALRDGARQLPGLLSLARGVAGRDRGAEPPAHALVGEGVLVAAGRSGGRAAAVDPRRADRDGGGAACRGGAADRACRSAARRRPLRV